MTEAEAIVMRLSKLKVGQVIPYEDHLHLGAVAMKIREAQWANNQVTRHAPKFAQIGPWLFNVDGTPWRTPSAGAVALALAVTARGQWVRLPAGWSGRSIQAWRAAIGEAIKGIHSLDIDLAKALKGAHLRSTLGGVEILLRIGDVRITRDR